MNCIIPIILPITTPVLIGGLALLLGRGAIYKWGYGAPRGTLKKLHNAELLPLVIERFRDGLTQEKGGFFQTEHFNTLKLFYRRLDSKTERGSYSNAQFRFSQLTGFQERITLGTVFEDFGEDILMSLLGTSDVVIEDSRSKLERVFHGFYFEIPNVSFSSTWMAVPTKALSLYRKKSHYPQNLFITTVNTRDTTFLLEKDAELPDGKIIDALNAAQPAYVQATKGKVYLAIPSSGNPLRANFDHTAAYSKEQLEQFHRVVSPFNRIKDALPIDRVR